MLTLLFAMRNATLLRAIAGNLQSVGRMLESGLMQLNASAAPHNHSAAADDCHLPDDPCADYSHNVWMFSTVLYVGSSLSLLSVGGNVLIFYALLRDARCWNTHFIFLLFLALFDTVASALYIPVIVLDQAKDRFDIPLLASFWHATFTYLMAAVNVALTSSCYLIVTLQFERYLITRRSSWINASNRPVFACLAVVASLLMKAPMATELTLIELPVPCGRPNVTESVVVPTQWDNELVEKIYSIGYKFWARNVFTIFFPFALLLWFNVRIVRKLNTAQRRADLFQLSGQAEHKNKARAATRTFVLIACCYLASNAVNVAITAWEHIDMDSLNARCDLYLYSTDVVSLLTMCGCALRLPIYLATNADLRRVITHAACALCTLCPGANNKHLSRHLFTYNGGDLNGCRRLPAIKPHVTPFDNVAVNIALNFNLSPPPAREQLVRLDTTTNDVYTEAIRPQQQQQQQQQHRQYCARHNGLQCHTSALLANGIDKQWHGSRVVI